ETICLKCLDKEPLKRYRTAADLADDLRRWRDGDAIAARPAGLVERLLKWTRRRPAVAAASVLGLVVLALALVSLGAIGQLDKVEQARQEVAARAVSESAARQDAEQNRVVAETEKNVAQLSLDKADRILTSNNVLRAHLAWQTGEEQQAAQALDNCPAEL